MEKSGHALEIFNIFTVSKQARDHFSQQRRCFQGRMTQLFDRPSTARLEKVSSLYTDKHFLRKTRKRYKNGDMYGKASVWPCSSTNSTAHLVSMCYKHVSRQAASSRVSGVEYRPGLAEISKENLQKPCFPLSHEKKYESFKVTRSWTHVKSTATNLTMWCVAPIWFA